MLMKHTALSRDEMLPSKFGVSCPSILLLLVPVAVLSGPVLFRVEGGTYMR